MRRRSAVLLVLLALVLPAAASAQGIMGEMHRDVNEVQKKIIDLAKAMPEAAFAWRPAADVRSVGEVFLHISSDNYLIPIGMGMPAPAASGITSDFTTATTYEKKKLSKAEIIADMETSFAHLHRGMGLTTDANLTETIKFFGQDWTRQRAMVLTVTHLHEHLGQLIAYARSNGVKPPWSR